MVISMKETIPERKFERNLQQNYLIFQNAECETNSEYIVKMIVENKILGMIPVKIRMQDGIEAFYYEINSMQPIERVFERQNMNYENIQLLIKSYIETVEAMEEYLLESKNLLLNPSCIYFHSSKQKIEFLFYPYYEKESKDAWKELTEFLLLKTDHTEEKAVKLVYQLYKLAREDNFSFLELKEMMNSSKQKEEIREQDKAITPIAVEEQELEKKEALQETEKTFISFEQEANCEKEEKSSYRIISILSTVVALISLVVFVAEKGIGLFVLDEQMEIILFGVIVAFAISGIVFRVLFVREQKEKPMTEELRQFQKDQIYHEIAEDESQTFQKHQSNDTQIISNWENIGETTIIGEEKEKKNTLIMLNGSFNKEYPMTHFPFLVGRMSTCVDLTLEDSSVSKMHARFEEKNGEIYLQDMNSTNGTKKNGMMLRLNESTLVEAGDEITFGQMTFLFQ